MLTYVVCGDHLLMVYEHIIISYMCSYILDASFVPAQVVQVGLSTQEMLSLCFWAG